MARQTNHSGVVALSSIALLQERFRQLQRVKEMRQEKELLRLLSESDRYSPPVSHKYDLLLKTFPGSQARFLPPKPHCQLSLSLWPDSHNKQPGSRGVTEGPSSLAKSWFTDAPMLLTSSVELENYGGSDVDTSLRL